MQLIIISSTQFTGEVYVQYSDNNFLAKVDFTCACMNDKQMCYLVQKLPLKVVHIPELVASIKADSETVQIEVIALEPRFEEFWETYNVKRNRERSYKLFKKLTRFEQWQAIGGVAVYNRYLAKNSWRNKAEPDTYLSGKYWQNAWK